MQETVATAVQAADASVPAFALPDHQVIKSLLPAIDSQRLGIDEAVERIRASRFLVPVAINPAPARQLIYFAGLGDHAYREWQHVFSVQQLARSGRIRTCFSAPAALLEREDLIETPRSPRGLILHVSRCGSTLLGKALARADGIGVINQPTVLQHGFWAWICDNWGQRSRWRPETDSMNLRRFRNLVHLLCRRRRDDEDQIFIKFISWNSLYVDFIRQAFPEAPVLFMYRNPVEVIASVFRQTTAVLLARGTRQAEFLADRGAGELHVMDDLAYLAACYGHYFDTMLRAEYPPGMLNYAGFTPDVLDRVLEAAFSLQANARQLRQMRDQFSVYSKDDNNRTGFTDDSRRKRQTLSREQLQLARRYCNASWQRLLQSPHNII